MQYWIRGRFQNSFFMLLSIFFLNFCIRQVFCLFIISIQVTENFITLFRWLKERQRIIPKFRKLSWKVASDAISILWLFIHNILSEPHWPILALWKLILAHTITSWLIWKKKNENRKIFSKPLNLSSWASVFRVDKEVK